MKAMLSLALVFSMVSITQGGTISFSGRDWTTRDGGGNTYGTAPAYVVDGPESATATGAWTDAAMMLAALDLSVGDVIRCDWVTTKELRNHSGAGDFDWIGDMWTGFLSGDPIDLETYAYTVEVDDKYFNAGPFDYSYVWTFDSETTAVLEITDNSDVTTTTQNVTLATGVSAVTAFVAASWDTEQDFTISNFVHTPIPEPATIVLLGLGSLLLLRRIGR